MICPIDWGLGHATRSIPIIQELRARGCRVTIASSGPALALLTKEFPDLPAFSLTGYRPFYSSNGSFIGSLFLQIPKFIRTIRAEHQEVEKLILREGIDVVISDNRFGCWSKRVPSIIITHQLRILAPVFLSAMINFMNRRLIRKFSAIWVPDWEGPDGLSGPMVASDGLAVRYIGPLSRLLAIGTFAKKYEVLALISGPEPQREALRNLLQAQIRKSGRPALLVCGLPGQDWTETEGLLTVVSHLPMLELSRAVLESDIVISRSGYSTIMDLAALGGKAIFIPTPGQPEQEYLGRELMAKKIAFCVNQDSFELEEALEQAVHYTGFIQAGKKDYFKKALDSLQL